ncbi:MAG: ATP-grasp domain-containing protein [Planctomycetota bacterium]|nr:ATP-grasp domain-containing protein [Planctomycetota bacterium]MDA1211921.1 ATP-grasp domain-containing protein [Planctomycetota bacterium]
MVHRSKRRVLVSESICGGGCEARHPSDSLFREGKAMLSAILADFSRVSDLEIWTTWDRRWGTPRFDGVNVIPVSGPEEERSAWERLIGDLSDVLVIAPESHGILAARAEFFESRGCRLLGPSAEAIRLCSDKWETFRFLRLLRLPTIETQPLSRYRLAAFDEMDMNCENGCVLKPRDGAGSQGMHRVDFADAIEAYRTLLDTHRNSDVEYLLQPYIAGMSLSCSALFYSQEECDIFPIGRQYINVEKEFAYEGGELPVEPALAADVQASICRMIRTVCRNVPGLRGYVGFDLILPFQQPNDPLIVEINPRLTTSYLGYRQLTATNLAERMLERDDRLESLFWDCGKTIRFRPEAGL